MKMSEFWRLMDDEFGAGYSRTLARRHAIHALNDRTVEQALADGIAPRSIWNELCEDMQVPPERRLGVDLPIRERKDL